MPEKISSLPRGPQPAPEVHGHIEKMAFLSKERELFCVVCAPAPFLHGLDHGQASPLPTLGQALFLRNSVLLSLSLALSCYMTSTGKAILTVKQTALHMAALWRF